MCSLLRPFYPGGFDIKMKLLLPLLLIFSLLVAVSPVGEQLWQQSSSSWVTLRSGDLPFQQEIGQRWNKFSHRWMVQGLVIDQSIARQQRAVGNWIDHTGDTLTRTWTQIGEWPALLVNLCQESWVALIEWPDNMLDSMHQLWDNPHDRRPSLSVLDSNFSTALPVTEPAATSASDA